jgi:6-phosphofructokinase 1
VFIVEVQGGNCGYLATLGGLSTGATTTYIPEEGISLDRLQTDIKHLIRRYKEEDRWGVPNEGRIILRNESVSKKTYTTDVISAMVKEEGHGLFDSKTAVLGHLQQGGVPSPLDRIRAVRLAVHCAEWIEAHAFAAIEHSKSHLPAKVSTIENINHEDSVDHRSPRQLSMEAEASKLFTSKIKTPLGHMQTVYTPQSGTASVIGIRGSQVCFIGEALLIF